MSKAYFAKDGSFGDASEIEIIDVSNWTDDDWNEVQDEMDEFRLMTARAIAKEKIKGD